MALRIRKHDDDTTWVCGEQVHEYGTTQLWHSNQLLTKCPCRDSHGICISAIFNYLLGKFGREAKETEYRTHRRTVGGCVILSLVALTAFLIHRRRVAAAKQQSSSSAQFNPHSSPEFDPKGFPSAWGEQDIKTWQQQQGSVHSPGGMQYGISEVHGEDRAVEIAAPDKNKLGHWGIPGSEPVEVEAGVTGRDEKRWRGAVEAPT
jgi:hypothetical protein